MRDSFWLGPLAGIIGNIPKEVSAWFFYSVGTIPFTFDHFCAGMYLPRRLVHHWAAIVSGVFSDFTIAAAYGTLLALLMQKTGFNSWALKGLAFGSALYSFCFGMLRPMVSPQLKIADPIACLLFIVPHLLYGVCASWFIKRYRMHFIEE